MIEINNLTPFSADERFLKTLGQRILKEEDRKDFDLSVAFVDRARIKELNKRYLKKNKPTDVLSFPNKNFSFNAGRRFLGEIVICPRVVKENANKFNASFSKELARIFIHGILHLAGYDHETGKKDAKIMEEKENYYIEKYFNSKHHLK